MPARRGQGLGAQLLDGAAVVAVGQVVDPRRALELTLAAFGAKQQEADRRHHRQHRADRVGEQLHVRELEDRGHLAGVDRQDHGAVGHDRRRDRKRAAGHVPQRAACVRAPVQHPGAVAQHHRQHHRDGDQPFGEGRLHEAPVHRDGDRDRRQAAEQQRPRRLPVEALQRNRVGGEGQGDAGIGRDDRDPGRGRVAQAQQHEARRLQQRGHHPPVQARAIVRRQRARDYQQHGADQQGQQGADQQGRTDVEGPVHRRCRLVRRPGGSRG